MPLQTPPPTSPARGEVGVEAVLFDTFGTVVDFYRPFKRGFEELARDCGVDCDAGRLAIDWRTAYLFSTVSQAMQEDAFRPLRQINRDNLAQLLEERFPAPVSAARVDELATTWEKLDPWPDVVEGLHRLRRRHIIAPLSNGNFADMVRLSRHAGLPWDIILGASISGYYKPHPSTYLKSVEALALQPAQVCMVAAHQADLAFAAGHGMQTAFVPRPQEFGGAVKPREAEPGRDYLDAAEIHPEGDWTYVAEDFVDLAEQLEGDHAGS
ncbi:MAG: haloacid dehalogenase type II [Halioglobus sp.]|nr:haloacid dehalogenase type II [Halioglobus sp.]